MTSSHTACSTDGAQIALVVFALSLQRRLGSRSPCLRIINSLVMDYLVSEGYPESAQNFASEANISPHVHISSIQDRVAIRNYICSGRISQAIECLNEFDPEVRWVRFFLRNPNRILR